MEVSEHLSIVLLLFLKRVHWNSTLLIGEAMMQLIFCMLDLSAS